MRGSKRQRLDLRDNKEGESLDKFEDEDEEEDIRYIPHLFIVPPQKKSNCPINRIEEIKSLNHLVYIPKIG